ncbi:FHA domain-containing protein [Actinomadura sp. GC306]|uniref:FHA domain-containing protein n=1 Tax=Actinomadura sp. GC306 TaxID=2530367 RepID=UPI00105208FA|nr:FHA domain-containing protein [Actinomadura sp. GC306]TDC70798.1 FHA domain-containing protein [Actinomadura sp. GC306]
MAGLTYRCPEDPENCPAGDEPGSCEEHFAPWEHMPEYAGPAVPEPEDPGVPDADPAGSGTPATGVALLFEDTILPVPPEGMRIGRTCPPWKTVPGFADLHQVSREHAELYWRDGTLMINDLGSTNGTHVAGVEIGEPAPIPPGTLLRLGNDVHLTVAELDEFGFPRT